MLAVIETPVNKFLFDVSLQSSNATSYLVSFAVAVFVLVAAHAAGKSARQVWSEYRTKHHWSNIALSIGVLIVLLGVVSVLTIGRGEFAAARLDPGLGGVFSAVKEKVVSIGFWGALSHALADTSALVLMTINIASIMVAFLLGFLSHDPDKHFDKAFERHKACQVSMERYEAKYSKAVSSICEQARKKLNAINIRYSAANAAIVAQKTARRIPLDDEDRFSLPRLDRMLVRASEQSGSIFGAGSPTIATPAMS